MCPETPACSLPSLPPLPEELGVAVEVKGRTCRGIDEVGQAAALVTLNPFPVYLAHCH